MFKQNVDSLFSYKTENLIILRSVTFQVCIMALQWRLTGNA